MILSALCVAALIHAASPELPPATRYGVAPRGATTLRAKAAQAHRHKRPPERVLVEKVLGLGDGQYVVVLRTQGKPSRYLPIWVGEMEAVAIRMRLDRQQPPRPLTLNLLESVLRAANIKVTEVAINDFQGGVFLATLRCKQNHKTWDIEARPSDAIGLAVGRGAPIWVSRDIIDGAALDPKTLPDLPLQEPADEDDPPPIEAPALTEDSL